jgi:predicted methyltransferase
MLGVMLLGCDPTPPPEPSSEPAQDAAPEARAEPAADDRLDTVLAAMPDAHQARYVHRHPKQTLEFFGVLPGMTVVEALPGGGWYSQVLVPYLGAEGRLIGANYASDLWPKFGTFDQDFINSMQTWVTDWPEQAQAWRGDDGASIEAFEFGSLPAALQGQADAVLLIRALHNLARFEADGGYLTTALNDVHRVLKPGGVVGVVQHEARPDMPDEWASGANGYLKKQFVIDQMAEAGLEFVEGSAINENPSDQPTTDDIVWRLPPSYATSSEDPELRAEVDAVGESNRMTLKFRKPQ